MLPYSFIGTGTYTNPATSVAVNIALNDQPDYFMVRDLTNWGSASTATPQLESFWYSSQNPASYWQYGQTSVAAGVVSLYTAKGVTGGFTFINPASPPTFAALASTGINATTWVVLMANTGGIAVGDYVRVINPVGMLQAASIVGQVTAVTVNTSITLGYIASAVTAGGSFTANATSASILKFFPSQFYPRKEQVMYIKPGTGAQAGQTLVYFAEQNDFTPGEIVDFYIPTTYGMTQLNALTGAPGGAPTVLSVTNTATDSHININVNSSGFTPFAYPTSALSVGAASPPYCVPAGSGVVPGVSPPGTNLQDAFDNFNQYYMNIGTNVVGAASATMQWTAWKADYNQALSNQ